MTPDPNGQGKKKRGKNGRGHRVAAFLRSLRGTLRFGDLLLAAVVVTLALGLWSGFQPASASAATGAVLLRDGQTVLSFTLADLQKDADYSVVSYGYHYTIRTGGGRIRFEQADCPDRICVLTGWIGRPPQVAVCIPGHLLLRILGDSGGVDALSG